MPAYYYYSAITGAQTSVNGGAVNYNSGPPNNSSWSWSGSTTNFVLTEANSGGAFFNGDGDQNERIDVNDRIGGIWEQTVEVDGIARQVIWDYTFEVTDPGTGTVYRVGVIDVDLNNDNDLNDAGEDGYFIVFPDGFPPANTALTVGGIVANDDSISHVDPGGLNGTVVCFVTGTLIDTPSGPRPVETLRPGDLVVTVDDGNQPVRWTGSMPAPPEGPHRPVVFEAGVLGNARPLAVSPQHCVALSGPLVQLWTGDSEVLVRAMHLVGRPGVRRSEGDGGRAYHHLLFDRHQMILAEGAASESLYPGPSALAAMSPEARDAVTELAGAEYGPTARRVLTLAEALCLPLAATYRATPRRPARSVKYCQATRPDRPPRVADHSIASARRSASSIPMP